MLLSIFLRPWFVSMYFLLNNLHFCQQFKMCKTLGFSVDITHRLTNAEEDSLIPQVIWQLKLALIFDMDKVFPSVDKNSICFCAINLFLYIHFNKSAFHFRCQSANFLKIFTTSDHLTMFTSRAFQDRGSQQVSS